jgi:hypothetical protein
MEPVTLLQKQLEVWHKALEKSALAFREGKISREMHFKHKSNLEPKIKLYNIAIEILNKHLQ